MIPSITKILKIEAFKILVMWDNGELRVIDFAKNFDSWKKENNITLLPLLKLDPVVLYKQSKELSLYYLVEMEGV